MRNVERRGRDVPVAGQAANDAGVPRVEGTQRQSFGMQCGLGQRILFTGYS
jgi:hypothetical protein